MVVVIQTLNKLSQIRIVLIQTVRKVLQIMVECMPWI